MLVNPAPAERGFPRRADGDFLVDDYLRMLYIPYVPTTHGAFMRSSRRRRSPTRVLQEDRIVAGQWLAIPDSHIPFEHKRAYGLMLDAAETLNGGRGPVGILIGGDFGDFYAVNQHGRYAGSEVFLRKEVAAVNGRLDELDERWPRAEKVFLQGNHEFRFERYLDAKAPDLFGLVSTESILKFDRRKKWKYVPYGPGQLVRIGGSKLFARHEPLAGGVLPAHGTVVKAGCSVLYFHTHTAQSSQVVMANGDTHIGVSVGWLGDPDHWAFSYVKGHHQWSHGFGIVTVLPDGNFFVETARIIDWKTQVNGKVIRG